MAFNKLKLGIVILSTLFIFSILAQIGYSDTYSTDPADYYYDNLKNWFMVDGISDDDIALNGSPAIEGGDLFKFGWTVGTGVGYNYSGGRSSKGDLSMISRRDHIYTDLQDNASFTGAVGFKLYYDGQISKLDLYAVELGGAGGSIVFGINPPVSGTNFSWQNSGQTVICPVGLTVGWHEILLNYTNSNTVRGYVDGVYCAVNTGTPSFGGIVWVFLQTQLDNVYYGVHNLSIDEFWIANNHRPRATPTGFIDNLETIINITHLNISINMTDADSIDEWGWEYYPNVSGWVNKSVNGTVSPAQLSILPSVVHPFTANLPYRWWALDGVGEVTYSEEYNMSWVKLAAFEPPTIENGTKNNTLVNMAVNVSCTNLGEPTILFAKSNESFDENKIVAHSTTAEHVVWNLNSTIVDESRDYHFMGTCDNELNATDVINTTIRYWTYDAIEPTIILESNNGFTASNITLDPYSNDLYLNVSVYDNEDLFAFQVIGRHLNGSVYLNYTNATLSGSQNFNYSNYINVTNFPSGDNYLYEIRASDSHTADRICPYGEDDCYKPKKRNSQLEFNTLQGVNITIVTKDPSIANYTFEGDRYTFEFDFLDNESAKRKIDLLADKPLIYVGETSNYIGHFVVIGDDGFGGNWIDFIADNFTSEDVKIKYITDYHYELEFDKPKDKLKFKSIGGLNINEQYFTYTRDRINISYVDIQPLFPIDSSDLQAYCTATSDLGYNVSYHWNVLKNGATQFAGNSSYLNSSVVYHVQNVSNSLTTVWDNWSIECRANTTLSLDYSEWGYYNTTVYNFTLDNCTLSNNTVLNFSAWNENTPDSPLVIDITGTLEYAVGDLTHELLIDYSNVSNFLLCIYPPVYTYDLNAYFQYHTSDDTGVQERFYIDNANISNTTNDVYLYNFDDVTGLSELLVVTYDFTYATFEGLLGKLQRFYPGENLWRTVQLDKTDDEGQLIFYVYQNTHDYRIIWEEDGEFYDQTANLKFVCDSPTECQASFVAIDQGDEDAFAGLTYSLTYDNSTEIISLTWADSNSFVTAMRLLVQKEGLSDNLEICDTTLASSSGTINCDITGYDGVIKARAYRASSPFDFFDTLTVDKIVKALSDILESSDLGEVGGFMSMLVTMVLIGFGAATGSPIVVVLFIILGAIANFFLGIGTFFTYAMLFTIGVVGLIVAMVVRR